MIDVLEGKNLNVNCLDKGFVKLIDVMPRLVTEGQTADSAIVQAARVSYGDGTKTVNEDRGLIRYLMRHAHTTPTEMVEFKWHLKIPIFIARQIARHRSVNANEISGRYSILKDEFHIPEKNNIRKQSTINKQGGDQQIEEVEAEEFIAYVDELCERSYQQYLKFLDKGISREQARMILPLNLYTEMYWKIDLHNLFHFLALRCDSHAQWEVREVGNAMLDLITPIVPWSVQAWNDYHPMRNAVKLTRLEIEAISKIFQGVAIPAINSDNKREQSEWKEKAARLGFAA